MKKKLLILILLVGTLALRHVVVFFTAAEILHLEALADSFAMIDNGQAWVGGQLLGGSGVRFGGPLYSWLNYPARFWDNPVLGVHINNFGLELASLLVWLFWPTRGALRQDLRWIAGALLVLYPEPKMEVCENAAVMLHLLPPLLVTLVWALRGRSWISMLLPGALWGAALVVHASSAVLLPALVFTVIWQRQLVARRLLLLFLGTAAVCAVMLHGAQHDVQQGQRVWQWIWDSASARRAGLLLLHLVKDPTALLGLVLLLIAWRRGQRPAAVELLALVWFVVGVLCLALLYSRLESRLDPFMPRFALANPGRVLLSAAGLSWVLARIRRWAGPRWDRVLRWDSLVPATMMLTILIMAVMLPRLRDKLDEDLQQHRRHPCLCDQLEREMWSRYRLRFFDQLIGHPAVAAPGSLCARGLLGKDLAIAASWRPGSGRPAVPRRQLKPTAVLPKLSGLAPADPGGAAGQRLLLIPGCTPLDTRALTSGRLVPGPHGQSGTLALIILVSNQPRAVLRAPRVNLVDRKTSREVPPLDRCACRQEGPFVGGWYLFDLQGRSIADLRLVADPPDALSWDLSGVFIPRKEEEK